MKEEKKNNRPKNKIVPIWSRQEELKDPGDLEGSALDDLLRREIMREADELEEKLNNDPSLAGVGASDDLFNVIVGKLKEQGIWEEDEEQKTPELEESEETGQAAGELVRSEVREQKEQVEQKGSSSGEISCNGQRKDCAGKSSDVDLTAENLEQLYRMLPERDRQVLERERKRVQRRAEKARRRKYLMRKMRPAGVGAALLVILCGVGLSSEANRKRIFDALQINVGFELPKESIKNEDYILSKSTEEQEALSDIKETLGIPVLYFIDVPEEITFVEYEIMPDTLEAVMTYTYNGNFFMVEMFGSKAENLIYYNLDQEKILVDTVKTDQNVVAKISETNLDQKEKTYLVDLKYGECRYVLNGKISLEKIKNLADYIYFL